MGRGSSNLLYGQANIIDSQAREYDQIIKQLKNPELKSNIYSDNLNWLLQPIASNLYLFLKQHSLKEDFTNKQYIKINCLLTELCQESFPSEYYLSRIDNDLYDTVDRTNKVPRAMKNIFNCWDSYQKLFSELSKVKQHLPESEQKTIDQLIQQAAISIPMRINNLKSFQFIKQLNKDLYNNHAFVPQLISYLYPTTYQTKQVKHYLLDHPQYNITQKSLCNPQARRGYEKWMKYGKDVEIEQRARDDKYIKDIPVCSDCLGKSQKNGKHKFLTHELSEKAFDILVKKQLQPRIENYLSSSNPPQIFEAVQYSYQDWLTDKLTEHYPKRKKMFEENRDKILTSESVTELGVSESYFQIKTIDFKLNVSA
jgi:hypothetical protein